VNQIAARGPAFVAHLGDITTRGGSKKQWQEFDDLSKALREKKIPYFPILGNHDLYGNKNEALQNYCDRFPHLEQRRCYSFAWKDIGLIMVDSNFSTLIPERINEQMLWYLGELERYEKDDGVDYVIVCSHEPPFTNSRVVRPNRRVETNFVDPFLRFQKTCLFFSGHSHTYERFQNNGKFFIVSGGGGGPRHKVSMDPTNRRFHDLFEGPELRFFHIVEIEVLGSTIAYKILYLKPDDTFVITDSLEIKKPSEDKMSPIKKLAF
jgi:3',5'-cyclic AMP phosphodiesterase CpdA